MDVYKLIIQHHNEDARHPESGALRIVTIILSSRNSFRR